MPDAASRPTGGCTGAGRPTIEPAPRHPGHLGQDAAAGLRAVEVKEKADREDGIERAVASTGWRRRCTGRPGTPRPSLRRATREHLDRDVRARTRRSAARKGAARAVPVPQGRSSAVPHGRSPARRLVERPADGREVPARCGGGRAASRSATSRTLPPHRRRGSAPSRASNCGRARRSRGRFYRLGRVDDPRPELEFFRDLGVTDLFVDRPRGGGDRARLAGLDARPRRRSRSSSRAARAASSRRPGPTSSSARATRRPS